MGSGRTERMRQFWNWWLGEGRSFIRNKLLKNQTPVMLFMKELILTENGRWGFYFRLLYQRKRFHCFIEWVLKRKVSLMVAESFGELLRNDWNVKAQSCWVACFQIYWVGINKSLSWQNGLDWIKKFSSSRTYQRSRRWSENVGDLSIDETNNRSRCGIIMVSSDLPGNFGCQWSSIVVHEGTMLVNW